MSNINLTTFLLQPTKVVEFENALATLIDDALPLAPPLDGYFIPIPAAPHTPPWAPQVQSVLQNPTALQAQAQAPGGIIVIRRPGGTFAITFGHAWMKIRNEWVAHDFGRRVALNAIPPNQLIEVRAEQVFARWHLANERAPRATTIDDFNVAFDRDLVGAITGVPDNIGLGGQIKGATSLRATIKINNLETFLDSTATLYASNDYKQRWPEIDNIESITDQQIINQLDARLDVALATPQQRRHVVMFTPAAKRDEPLVPDSYIYGRQTRNPARHPYLTIEGWTAHLARLNTPPTVTEAKRSKIHLLDEQHDELADATAYECFGFETNINQQQYVLSSGIWYHITATFIRRINNAINAIPTPTAALPAWNGGDSEGTYNNNFATSHNLLLFDAKPLHYGGQQSQFEFCDVLDLDNRVLYFAKIPLKSAGMSHLIEQVRRTAELFFSTDDGYRTALRRLVTRRHPNARQDWLDARPRNGEWELCLVSLGKAKTSLPFFAKNGLYRLHKELTERGHNITYTKV